MLNQFSFHYILSLLIGTAVCVWKIELSLDEILEKPQVDRLNARKVSKYCENYQNQTDWEDEIFLKYHNETGKCYALDSKGPCGLNMIFTMVDSDFGTCDCNIFRRCGRPLIYYEKTDSCYFSNDRGPCEDGYWLVFGPNQESICEKNPCRKNHRVGGSKYWFTRNGTCYQTKSRGYCENRDAIYFNRWEEFEPTCNVGSYCGLSRAKSLSCLPGQKLERAKKCRKILEY